MNRAIIHGLAVKKIKRLSDDDQKLIAEAEMPEIEQITPELLHEIQTVYKGNTKVTLQCCAIVAVGIIVSIVLKIYDLTFTFCVAEFLLLISAFLMHLRAQIDDTAVMMRIPVHSTKEHILVSNAVCYLPDGKYHIRYSNKFLPPTVVCYMEFGKFTYRKYQDTPITRSVMLMPDNDDEPDHEETA